MKIKKKITFKIFVILMITIMLSTFSCPTISNADLGGALFAPIIDFFAGIGDVIVGGLQYFMLGTSSVWSTTLKHDDANVRDMKADIENGNVSPVQITISEQNLQKGWFPWEGTYDFVSVPNIIYTPELIFSNKVPALDINFLDPSSHTYQQVEEATDVPTSSGEALHDVVSTWYVAFRNIAIVGLLSVLVYIGIRIVISSSAEDKSKYKKSLVDWITAMCLLFLIHYIMAFTIVITEEITKMFASAQTIDVLVTGKNVSGEGEPKVDFAFKTTLMGYIRFLVQSADIMEKAVYTILYLVLVVYTIMFTVTYLKRVLYMAFFTMIAPLVALTYPLDKLSDGQAQAFNTWLKEYIFNALMQPMHLALYTMLIGASISLAAENPIYALVAMGFLMPAEKFIKKMFGFNKSETASGGGGFMAGATGALAMNAINKIKSKAKGNNSSDDSDDKGKIWTADKGVNTSVIGSGALNPQRSTGGSSGGKMQQQRKTSVGVAARKHKSATSMPKRKNGVTARKHKPAISMQKTRSRMATQNGSQLGKKYKKGVTVVPRRISNGGNIPASIPTNKNIPTPTRGQRLKNVAKREFDYRKRQLRSQPKKLAKKGGKFLLNTATAGVKGLAGMALAAIPAGVAAVASGGDLKTAGQIMLGGAGAAMALGPSGNDISKGVTSIKDRISDSYYTKDEKKDIEAQKKVRDMKQDEKQLAALRKRMIKGGAGIDADPLKWIENNEALIKSYAKKDVKDIDTIFGAEEVRRKNPGMSQDYAIELARQKEALGDHTNDANYMQSYRKEMLDSDPNLTQKDVDQFIKNLKDIQG